MSKGIASFTDEPFLLNMINRKQLAKHLAGQHDQSSHGSWADGMDEKPYKLKQDSAQDVELRNEPFVLSNRIWNPFSVRREEEEITQGDIEQDILRGFVTSAYLPKNPSIHFSKETDEEFNGWIGEAVTHPDYPISLEKLPKDLVQIAVNKFNTSWAREKLGRDVTVEDFNNYKNNSPWVVEGSNGYTLDVTKEVMRQFKNYPLRDQIDEYVKKENAFMTNWFREYEYVSGEKVSDVIDGIDSQIKSELKDIVLNNPVRVQMPASRLARLVKDERYKTVFESRSVGKGLKRGEYLESRLETETKFGVPKDLLAENRPVYGYFATDNFEEYGNVRLELKDSVKNRTSLTVGDSIDSHPQSTMWASDVVAGKIKPVTNLGWYGMYGSLWYQQGGYLKENPNYKSAHGGYRDDNPVGSAKGGTVKRMSRYIEAQVHGGVKLSDVSRVYISSIGDIGQTTFNKLRRSGIEVIIDPTIRQSEIDAWQASIYGG